MIDNVRELARLILATDFGNRQIGRLLNCAPNTVGRYRRRINELALSWEQVLQIDDHALLTRINDGRDRHRRPFVVPDWAMLTRELRRPGVTVALLFQEYRSTLPPVGRVMMSEREFSRRFEKHRKTISVSMRQVHTAGEKLFVDFSGKRISYRSADGQQVPCEVFVATLGASSFTYVEAVRSQTLPDWTMAHVRALEFFGGAPSILVPDCLKSGVTSWKNGQAEINPTYNELASHYGAVVLPARPRKPKDKAKVERAVALAQRWILAALRNRTFFSIEEINAAIRPLLAAYNDRPFTRRKEESRRSLFEALDRPLLRPLPDDRFEFGWWSSAKVPPDYHVPVDGRAYSVPYILKGKLVRIRLSDQVVRIYHQGKEVAIHPRRREGFDDSTLPAHRPKHHRAYAERASDDAVAWASSIGDGAKALVAIYLGATDRPLIRDQRLRALRSIVQEVGSERFDKACARAVQIGSHSIRSLRSMLRARMEDAPVFESPSTESPSSSSHDNVRGAGYFGGQP